MRCRSPARPGKPAKPTRRFASPAPATAVCWLDQQTLLAATRAGSVQTVDV